MRVKVCPANVQNSAGHMGRFGHEFLGKSTAHILIYFGTLIHEQSLISELWEMEEVQLRDMRTTPTTGTIVSFAKKVCCQAR